MASKHQRSIGGVKGEKISGLAHRPSVYAGAIAVFILLLIAGVRVLGAQLYDYPSNPPSNEIAPDSVIICLAGGRGRIDAAFELYSSGVGAELVIIGAGPKTNLMTLIKSAANAYASKLPAERLAKITVEKESRNTIENAQAVGRYLSANPHVKKIVLVTSSYHMKRSLYILESVMGHRADIIPYTPPKEMIAADGWWGSWLGVQVTVVEYMKYLFARFVIPRLGDV